MTHDALYDQALRRICKLFSDNEVSTTEVRRSLRDLRGEIDDMLGSIEASTGAYPL